MVCINGLSNEFYIQKAFEYTQTDGAKSGEGMKQFVGANAEKWEELKQLEAIQNLLKLVSE